MLEWPLRVDCLLVLVASLLCSSCGFKREYVRARAELERTEQSLEVVSAAEHRLRGEVMLLQQELAAARERVLLYQENADAALRSECAAQQMSLRDLQQYTSALRAQCASLQSQANGCANTVVSLQSSLAAAQSQACPAAPPRYTPTPSHALRSGPAAEGWYYVEASAGDEVFIVNGEVFKAQTYCFDVVEGDEVFFADGDALGACVSATLVIRRTGDTCEVWCE